jgi:hypothetical protein
MWFSNMDKTILIEELIRKLNTVSSDEQIVREYTMGSSRIGAKYLMRRGAPGRYTYIYAPKRLMKLTRKARNAYAHFLKKSSKFLKSISLSYDAKALNATPVTWRTAIVNVQKQNGTNLMLHVDLKSHQIYSYKSKRGQGGASFTMARAKKKGILRFR